MNFDEKDVARLGSLDLKRARQIVDPGQVDILYVIGAVVVLDLAACPIEAFNLHHLIVLDGSAEGD